MTAARPLDWITEIESALVALDQKPQFGLPAPLNWTQLEKEIGTLLDKKECKLTYDFKGWMSHTQLFAGLGAKLLSLTIEWPPLQTPAFFVTEQQSLKNLMADVFGSDEAGNFFYESPYVQAFYNYFAAQILRLLEKQRFASPLTPRLGPRPEEIRELIGEETCFVIDIGLSFGTKNYWGRILLSENFRHSWKNYFAHLNPPSLSEEMKEKITVELSLEVAHAHLSLKEWKKVKGGDFIVLDRCSYDPQKQKGGVVLTLNQKPIFRGRLKDGAIKITNYPVYEEASDAMEEDESFDKDLDEDEDEDLYSELEDSEFEEEEEEDDIFAGLEPRKQPVEKEKEEKKPEKPIEAKLAPAEEFPPLSPEDLPLHLIVEVGRVRMTAGALMNLAPGNLLELNVTPEQGVDLIIHGKKVGKGELIRMGEVLGVRILSI